MLMIHIIALVSTGLALPQVLNLQVSPEVVDIASQQPEIVCTATVNWSQAAAFEHSARPAVVKAQFAGPAPLDTITLTLRALDSSRRPSRFQNRTALPPQTAAGLWHLDGLSLELPEGSGHLDKTDLARAGLDSSFLVVSTPGASATAARTETVLPQRKEVGNSSIIYLSRSRAALSSIQESAGGGGISASTTLTNRGTGTVVSEGYSFARSLENQKSIRMDNNGTQVTTEASFSGIGDLDFFKKDNWQAHDEKPTFQSSDSYRGQFRLNYTLDDYGDVATSDRSVSGEGAVTADRRLGAELSSRESGSGTYQAEESLDTLTGYLSKEISAVRRESSYQVVPGRWLNASGSWWEGVAARTNQTYLSERVSAADRLDKTSLVRGPSDISSQTSLSGRASFQARAGDSLEMDEEYVGNYTISRNMAISVGAGVPHLKVTKEGSLREGWDDRTYAAYTITLENDGGETLSPVRVTDRFPLGTVFVNASARPSAQDQYQATWTLTHLSPGDVRSIELLLLLDSLESGMVNRVYAQGDHSTGTVTAESYAAIPGDWLQCCSGTLPFRLEGWADQTDPTIARYRLSLTNPWQSSMAATISHPLPEGMRLVEASTAPDVTGPGPQTLVWTVSSVEPGETVTIDYRARSSRFGSILSTAWVDAYGMDGETASAQSDSVVVLPDHDAAF
ncbi:MAG: hypothetical protein A4E45_00020 [Methanosaeta sp. PtaB.Bin039]|nr:MAG: hypothetical protein A4E45_00020 [Methanosaeta sp. PtaB.Bin039]